MSSYRPGALGRSALILLLTAGCGLISEDPAPLPLEWSVEPRHGTLDLPVILVERRGQAIRISGGFGTPDPCHRLGASATEDGSDLTLRITAIPPEPQGCFDIVGGFLYTAVVRPTHPGPHRILVDHVRPSGTERVIDRSVPGR